MIYINEDDVIHPWSESGLQVFSQLNEEFASMCDYAHWSFTYLLSPAALQTAPKLSGVKSGIQAGDPQDSLSLLNEDLGPWLGKLHNL